MSTISSCEVRAGELVELLPFESAKSMKKVTYLSCVAVSSPPPQTLCGLTSDSSPKGSGSLSSKARGIVLEKAVVSSVARLYSPTTPTTPTTPLYPRYTEKGGTYAKDFNGCRFKVCRKRIVRAAMPPARNKRYRSCFRRDRFALTGP